MTALRAVLIAGMISLLAASPLLIPSFGGSLATDTTAYAARPLGADAGGIALDNHTHGTNPGKTGKNENDGNGNGNSNNNGNDNNSNGNDNNSNGNDNNSNGNDNNSNGNDNNSNGNSNSNSNGNGNSNSNGNGNGNDNGHGAGFQGGGFRGGNGGSSTTGTTKCFDVQEVGLIQRSFGDGDVTVSVPPDAGFSAITRLSLHSLDPASVAPVTGGTLLDSLVWTVDAQAGCDGPAITSLPGGANMGITYRVPADKSKVQIVMLAGGTWTNVTTVPDPNPSNPYVSATITSAGTYALIQKP